MHSRICIDSGKGQVLDTPFRHKKRQDECERLVKGVAIDVTTTASSSRAIFPMQTIVDYHLIIPHLFYLHARRTIQFSQFLHQGVKKSNIFLYMASAFREQFTCQHGYCLKPFGLIQTKENQQMKKEQTAFLHTKYFFNWTTYTEQKIFEQWFDIAWQHLQNCFYYGS